LTDQTNNKRKHTTLLVCLAVGMFGFAFALVPLYTVFCEITGLNGKTAGQAEYSTLSATATTSDREVTIQFLAQVGRGMPWEFRPTQARLRVRPGETYTTTFYARNRAAQAVVGQAVPSVAPGQAAAYLHKVECFCFNLQELEAGEAVEMPVTFYVDKDIPEEIRTFSLSYTLFRVTPDPELKVASSR
jgi:cytochrome c oxidase assembly protein subunit 11